MRKKQKRRIAGGKENKREGKNKKVKRRRMVDKNIMRKLAALEKWWV